MANIRYGFNGEGSGHSTRAREEKVESFLFNLDVYRSNLQQYPRQDNSALPAKVDELVGQQCLAVSAFR